MSNDTPLATLLFRTHAALVLLAVTALVAPLVGLMQTHALLANVTDVQLAGLDAEEAIYRAAWRVEVAARHASRACLVNPDVDPATIIPQVVEAGSALEATLVAHASRANAPLLRPAERYRDIARQTADGTCRLLGEIALERLMLDEELTEAWIDQLRGLHGALATSEREARRTAASSAVIAVVLGALGVLGAAFIAKRAARRVTRPLAEASAAAVRLGGGDFAQVAVAPFGVREIRELGEALGRMGQDLAALDRMKQQLLASVSHELHTPLGKLREALGLLADGTADPLTPRQARVVQLARDACEREIRTVAALLDISRLRSGRPLHRQSGCRIDAVVASAIDDERAEGDLRSVTIWLHSDGAAPSLELDVPLLERAVANLVRNAVSVSRPGATVDVRCAAADDAVLVEVEDRGPGLPAELRGEPFRAFESAAVGPRSGGLGLGLALAREVARAHGGDLEVSRTGETGTCFVLRLPTSDRASRPPS